MIFSKPKEEDLEINWDGLYDLSPPEVISIYMSGLMEYDEARIALGIVQPKNPDA